MVIEVLPSLDLIYLAGQPALSVGDFVAIRQLSDCPVTVVDIVHTKKILHKGMFHTSCYILVL